LSRNRLRNRTNAASRAPGVDPALKRARAMSTYLLVTVGGASLGLLLGGVLTHTLGWRWIFIINTPEPARSPAAAVSGCSSV
jgi:MFS family permease